MSNLLDKTALVTGATSGIGRAIVDALVAGGIGTLLMVSRSGADLAIPGRVRTTSVACDLGHPEQTEQLATQVAAMPGGLDVLVHCAGSFHAGSVEATAMAVLNQQLQINFKAPFVLTKALLPRLRHAGGQIVFVNSSVVSNPARGQLCAYTASKFALKVLADSLRAEINNDGVRVISIYPGRTATPMQESIYRSEGKPYHPEQLLQPSDVAASVIQALCMPKTAEVTDIYIRPFQK